MDNPLEQAVPAAFVDRVHAFARDLVYGAVNGLWSEVFIIYSDRWSITWRSGNYMVTDENPEHPFYHLIVTKWGGKPPSQMMLRAFGYYDKLQEGTNYEEFILTPKAFALLDQPLTPPACLSPINAAKAAPSAY